MQRKTWNLQNILAIKVKSFPYTSMLCLALHGLHEELTVHQCGRPMCPVAPLGPGWVLLKWIFG